MKHLKVFFICFLIGIINISFTNEADAQVNGENAMSVTTSNNITYTSVSNKRWAEIGSNGQPSFYFKETGRDAWSVYLQQEGLATKNIALDLWQKKVKLNGSPIYTITESSKSAQGGSSGNVTQIQTVTTQTSTSTSNTNQGSATNNTVSQADAINDYIWNLQYDRQQLLSVNMDLETQGLDEDDHKDTRENTKGAVIICKKTKEDYKSNDKNVTLTDPSSGVIYPGALIKVDQQMARGLPTAVSVARGDVSIKANLAGSEKIEIVKSITANTYDSKKNSLLEAWNREDSSRGYTNADNSWLRIQTGSSSLEIAAGLDLAATFDGGGLSAALSTDYSSEKEYLVAVYKQVYYTINADHPKQPSDLFDESVSLSRIKQIFPSNNNNKTTQPPGFVRSVDYGRWVIIRMESNKQDFELDLEASFQYAASGQSLDIAGNTHIKKTLANSNFSVFTLGGRPMSDVPVRGSETSKLYNIIEEGKTYNRSNPGVPLSYTVDFVKDNANAEIRTTGEYITEDCETVSNGYIELWIDGAFENAFFEVHADMPEGHVDDNYPPIDWKVGYKSGRQGNQFRKKIWLPGDAKNVKIITGRDHYIIGEDRLPGPTNNIYKIYGTIFSQGFVEIDPKTFENLRFIKQI